MEVQTNSTNRKGSGRRAYMDWKKSGCVSCSQDSLQEYYFIMMLITAAVLAVLDAEESTGKVQSKLDLSNSGFRESLLQDKEYRTKRDGPGRTSRR